MSQSESKYTNLMSDQSGEISQLYGMPKQSLLDEVLKKPYKYRALYIIDPDKVLQMISLHPFSMGHDMDEVLRVLDALRFTRMSKYAVSSSFKNLLPKPSKLELS